MFASARRGCGAGRSRRPQDAVPALRRSFRKCSGLPSEGGGLSPELCWPARGRGHRLAPPRRACLQWPQPYLPAGPPAQQAPAPSRPSPGQGRLWNYCRRVDGGCHIDILRAENN